MARISCSHDSVTWSAIAILYMCIRASGAAAIGEWLRGDAVMKSIAVDGSALPVRQLKGTEAVETIDLSGNGLGVASAIVIAKLIEGNRVLTSLNISQNTIGEEGAKVFAEVLRSGTSVLTKLDVSYNKLGSGGRRRDCQGPRGQRGADQT